MSDLCGSCEKIVDTSGAPPIKCSKCSKIFHSKEVGCSSVTAKSWIKKSPDNKSTWCCSTCRKRKSSDRDDDSSTVDDSDADDLLDSHTDKRRPSHEDNLYVKLAALLEKSLAPIKASQEEVLASQKDSALEIKSLRADVFALNSKISSLEASNSALEARCLALEEENKRIRRHVGEVADVKVDPVARTRIREFEDYSRRNTLVFRGIPDRVEGKDPLQLAIDLCQAVKVDIGPLVIDAAHRLPSSSPAAKPFIVKFCQRHIKDEVFHRFKQGGVSAAAFGGDPGLKIFCNEHLSAVTSKLFNRALGLKKVGFKFVWVRNGKIFVKQSSESKPIVISSDEDIERLFAGVGSERLVG